MKNLYNSVIKPNILAELLTTHGWVHDGQQWVKGKQEEDVAVTLVKKAPLGMSGLALVEKILTDEADKALLSVFTSKGGMVMVSATAFKFVLGGHALTVDVTLPQLTALNSDNPPGAVAAKYADAFSQVLQTAASWSAGETSVLNKLPPQAPPPAPTAKADGPTTWGTYPIAKMSSGVRKPLYLADQLYQPVNGTSSNSRYYMVAGNEEIKVAARYHGTALSIRIEGPQFSKHVARIKEVGLDPKQDANKHHASVHFTVPNDMVAAKALGAVLLGLGVEMRTKLPDIKVLKGK